MGRHRKAIAAGSGVLLIALLEYATTTPDVVRALELVVPHGVVPLVPVLVGGLATVAAVWKASNVQQSAPADTVTAPEPVDSMPPAPVPAPAPLSPQDVALTSSAGAGAPILDPPARSRPGVDSDSAPATSLVQLLPPPAPPYR